MASLDAESAEICRIFGGCNGYTSDLHTAERGIPALLNFRFGDVSISWMQVFIYAVTLAMMIGLSLIINKTRIGTAMRALAHS